ncbi:MAG: hypothetical protein E6R03_06610 [Hyphomicrobiaceae bacterium]|nr:MAG: hypothetical protein E6R03_06610 [Hyphomicrobiaceae bacterium]
MANVTVQNSFRYGDYSSPHLPAHWRVIDESLPPTKLGTTKSHSVSGGKYYIDCLLFENDLAGGNYFINQMIVSTIPGGVSSTVKIYIVPGSALGTRTDLRTRSNDLDEMYALYTLALKAADTQTVAGQTQHETMHVNCNITLKSDWVLCAVSNVVNNNVLTVSMVRQV